MARCGLHSFMGTTERAKGGQVPVRRCSELSQRGSVGQEGSLKESAGKLFWKATKASPFLRIGTSNFKHQGTGSHVSY